MKKTVYTLLVVVLFASLAWGQTTVKYPKVQGTPTPENCVKWVDGVTVGDAGAACGSGSGTYPGVTTDGDSGLNVEKKVKAASAQIGTPAPDADTDVILDSTGLTFPDGTKQTTATAGVSTFNSRTGAITPQSSDYASFYAALSHNHVKANITDLVLPVSKSCTGTDKISGYDSTTGVFTCTADQTGGGGSGTVNSGTSGQYAYYAANGTAVSGKTPDYNDLANRPTIPAAQVNSDWNAASGAAQILNKPTLGTSAALNVPASGNAAAGEVVKGSDTRLTDSRSPTSHASTHASAGSDPLTLAESQITNLVSDLAGKAASNASTTVNGVACVLGSTCSITADAGAQPFGYGVSYEGMPSSNAVLIRQPIPSGITWTIPLNCDKSRIEAESAATGSTTFAIYKCTGAGFTSCTQFGTATIGAGAKSAGFSCTATTLTGGTDAVKVVFGLADATLANIGGAVMGTR